MGKNDLIQKSRFAMVGTLMAIISLIFLFYIGSSLVNSTKSYQNDTIEMTNR